jgi:hypothetical protein
MLHEPNGQAVHVGTQPEAVHERPRVDAAVDLAAPVGQVVVLPAAVRSETIGGVTENRRVHAPLAQRAERPRRGRPWLAGVVRALGAVRVEVGREERAAGPLSVRVLERQEPGTETLRGDASTGRLPHGHGSVEQVTLHLPTQRGIGVEQPVDQSWVHDRQAYGLFGSGRGSRIPGLS